MNEIWKPIDGMNGLYEISNRGRVRSSDRYVGHRWGGKARKIGKVLRQALDKDGYRQVNLSVGGKSITAKVHRLVAKHFLPASDLPEVNHRDLDKANNIYTNLEWMSRKGNQEHASHNGRFLARNNPRRAKKLTRELIQDIRAARAEGMTYARLAVKFGISGTTALRVVRGEIWP